MQTNILSYFIKDIKDPLELDKYRQLNTKSDIFIEYNNSLIYHYFKYGNHSYNYITNISKENNLEIIYTARICYKTKANCKFLFYNKDNKIALINSKYIGYNYIYNKYGNLCKQYFYYKINDIVMLVIKIQYYNRSKYISYMYEYKSRSGIRAYKSQILIMNKYELHYISRLFNLYFGPFLFGDFYLAI